MGVLKTLSKKFSGAVQEAKWQYALHKSAKRSIPRDARLRIYLANAFIDPTEIKAVDMTLDKLPKKSFETVQKILNIYYTEPKKIGLCKGDFGHQIEIGPHKSTRFDLSEIFSALDSRRATPNVLVKLHELLLKHAEPSDLKLKL